MNFFKRNKKLIARIESLETELGYVYTTDVENWSTHHLLRGSYGIIARIEEDLKDLRDNQKGKK